jgi:hypothetical protein
MGAVTALTTFVVEFTASPEVVHRYDVKALNEQEALAMARADFGRIRRLHGATDYRVFNPRSMVYRAP